MMAFIAANLAPIMFASLVVFLLFGYPVAFGLAACGIFYAIVGIEVGALPASLFQALPLRIFFVMGNDTLLAIPFFTFMGLILERSGMAEDLLETIGQIFGPVARRPRVRGDLRRRDARRDDRRRRRIGHLDGPDLAADHAALRLRPARRLGVIAASGTLAQIIPPSLVLIVLADQLGKSVGDMYKGAFIPGFVLTGSTRCTSWHHRCCEPQWAPALPPEARSIREADGSSGLQLAARAGGIQRRGCGVFAKRYPESPFDEMLVSSLFFGVLVAFVIALIDKLLRINLLSEVAAR
jgi:TRAP-type mannitol/chloroaromatic compound transport system permease large subunit